GEISRQLLEPRAQPKAVVGLRRCGGSERQQRAEERTRETIPHRAARISVGCTLGSDGRSRSMDADAAWARAGGLTARYTVLQSCAAFDSSTSAADEPKGRR